MATVGVKGLSDDDLLFVCLSVDYNEGQLVFGIRRRCWSWCNLLGAGSCFAYRLESSEAMHSLLPVPPADGQCYSGISEFVCRHVHECPSERLATGGLAPLRCRFQGHAQYSRHGYTTMNVGFYNTTDASRGLCQRPNINKLCRTKSRLQ